MVPRILGSNPYQTRHVYYLNIDEMPFQCLIKILPENCICYGSNDTNTHLETLIEKNKTMFQYQSKSLSN